MEIPDLTPHLNEDFGWEPMEDGCLVYSLDGAQVLTLNSTAELILTHCDGVSPLPSIYQELAGEFAVTREDFMGVIDILLREKVLLTA
jgi:hypothetical protein